MVVKWNQDNTNGNTTGGREMRNKFEHLMNDSNREELKRDGKTTIMQHDKNWNREKPVATVNHYVTIRVPYYAAKKILNAAAYCQKREISKGEYDANAKTIQLTGLYPILQCTALQNIDVDVIAENYTYGM